jgi:hypothetical protein
MARLDTETEWTDRQRLLGGAVALLVGTICILSLTPTGTGGETTGMVLALLGVGMFVAGTLLIGSSGGERV